MNKKKKIKNVLEDKMKTECSASFQQIVHCLLQQSKIYVTQWGWLFALKFVTIIQLNNK